MDHTITLNDEIIETQIERFTAMRQVDFMVYEDEGEFPVWTFSLDTGAAVAHSSHGEFVVQPG